MKSELILAAATPVAVLAAQLAGAAATWGMVWSLALLVSIMFLVKYMDDRLIELYKQLLTGEAKK